MVELQFYKKADFPFLNYFLDDVQRLYTALPCQALARIEERNDGLAFPITIWENGKQVGFFVLDFGADKVELSDNQHSVLLRSFSVNPEFQGKGIGKRAMQQLEFFIHANFPDCNEVTLAVNKNNTSAYKLYLQQGFLDEGKTRMGRSGLQILMSKGLPTIRKFAE